MNTYSSFIMHHRREVIVCGQNALWVELDEGFLGTFCDVLVMYGELVVSVRALMFVLQAEGVTKFMGIQTWLL
jgi:hypothetical protein